MVFAKKVEAWTPVWPSSFTTASHRGISHWNVFIIPMPMFVTPYDPDWSPFSLKGGATPKKSNTDDTKK